ncbi:hypothetical protein GpartN1_g4025.t1 [Galdieria partita]|uniref:Uncharacterized protein n=1 Tax=Galdieria partita TaxID=83374 RepID=A0A9C7UQR2_9RHOD|nr:hypothetical protein GpartN1_g4025.t1 [Galdieria partita]
MSSSEEELPETITFSESRQRFRNKLKEENESKRAQKKRSVKQLHTQQGTTHKPVPDEERKDSSLQVPETKIFHQAANAARSARTKTVYLQNKKSDRRVSRKRSKKRMDNVEIILLSENSKWAHEKSSNDNPEKFLKEHFYGDRLLRCSRKDANLTRSKHLCRPSPYFYG